MRIVRYTLQGAPGWGVVSQNGIVNVGDRVGLTLDEALRSGEWETLARQHAGQTPDFKLDDIQYERPVAAPEKIICIGVNYARRNEEYRDGSEAPRYPSVFMRTPDSLVGHGQAMLRPPNPTSSTTRAKSSW